MLSKKRKFAAIGRSISLATYPAPSISYHIGGCDIVKSPEYPADPSGIPLTHTARRAFLCLVLLPCFLKGEDVRLLLEPPAVLEEAVARGIQPSDEILHLLVVIVITELRMAH